MILHSSVRSLAPKTCSKATIYRFGNDSVIRSITILKFHYAVHLCEYGLHAVSTDNVSLIKTILLFRFVNFPLLFMNKYTST
jgi:hypothetical protein